MPRSKCVGPHPPPAPPHPPHDNSRAAGNGLVMVLFVRGALLGVVVPVAVVVVVAAAAAVVVVCRHRRTGADIVTLRECPQAHVLVQHQAHDETERFCSVCGAGLVRACVPACLRARVPAYLLRACVPACLRACVTA